jgi:glutathione peroxidase
MHQTFHRFTDLNFKTLLNKQKVQSVVIIIKLNMKNLLLAILVFPFITVAQEKTIHDFTVEDISGEDFDLAQLKGKKVLIVNTASKCGLTHQYEDLQKLYDEYGGDDFVIIGFPANNFMKQEPGDNEEIAEFCQKNYGVSFPMMGKISVKGKDIHPLYKYLTTKEENGHSDNEVQWNFQKYLINADGTIAEVISSRTKPTDETIIKWIKG